MSDSDHKISLIDLWKTLDEESLDIYNAYSEEINRYMEKTNGDIKVSVLMFMLNEDIIYDEEIPIIKNESFIKGLLKKHNNDDVRLTTALYNASSVLNSKYLREVETAIIKKYQDGDLLNITKHGDFSVCPIVRDGKAYDENGNAIPVDKLFEYKDHCYNIDTLIRENDEGIHRLDDKLYERILTHNVKMNNENYTDKILALAVFSDLTTSIDLSNNRLMYLQDIVFPENTRYINLSNNPLIGLKCKFNDSIEELDLSHTRFEKIDASSLPSHIKVLKIRSCHSLKEINLTNLHNLVSIDISDCPLLRELELNNTLTNLTNVKADNNFLIKLRCDDVPKLSTISLQNFVNPIDRIIIANSSTIPVIKCDKCKLFSINKCTMKTVPIDIIPESTEIFQLINNRELTLMVRQFEKLQNLKQLRINGCPKITEISKKLFSNNFFNKGRKLDIAYNGNIEFHPPSAFNISAMQV